MLSWHHQQYYSLRDEGRTVRRKTLEYVVETLNIPPEVFFNDLYSDGTYNVVESVLQEYPLPILVWLMTERGKKAMLEQYAIDKFKGVKEDLAVEAAQVWQAIGKASQSREAL